MKIIEAMLKISSITMISRLLGYVRDALIASVIGTSPANDAFIAAFKLTNLFRTIFGEGAMSTAFTPIFSKLYLSHGDKYAKTVAMHIQALLILALLCFIGLVIAIMPWFIRVTTPGFAHNSSTLSLAIELSYITFPYLFFISLAAFYGSILNAKGYFAPYAFTSVLLNIVMILGIIIFANRNKATYSPESELSDFVIAPFMVYNSHVLAYSTLAAGIIELLWMFYFAKKHNLLLSVRKPFWYKYTKLLMKRIIPSLAGSSITQINIWVDMIIVSFVPGGMSYLYFADRIIQLPLALTGTALGTIMLTAAAKSEDIEQINRLFSKSVLLAGFLVIPAAFGLYSLDIEIVELLFSRGKFDGQAVHNTAAALSLWSWALPGFVIMKIVTSILYARGDTKSPVKIAILAVLINAGLGFGLLSSYSYLSVVIASIVSSWISAIILLFILHKDHRVACDIKTILGLIKTIIASSFMMVYLNHLKFLLDSTGLIRIGSLLIIITLGASIYFLVSFLLGSFKSLK